MLKVRYDSAKNRPDYYQQFYKIISVQISIKTVHADIAGNPAGTYILFINLVQIDPKSNWFVTELGSGP
ncbi:hypothetical protein D9M73_191770 [compost metagenome]